MRDTSWFRIVVGAALLFFELGIIGGTATKNQIEWWWGIPIAIGLFFIAYGTLGLVRK